MKSIFLCLMVVSLLACGGAFAVTDQGANSLGVYLAPDCETNCGDVVSGVPFSLYFMLANPTQDSMAGFEFSYYYDPEPASPPFVLDAELPPNALNIGDNSNFIVGLGTPLVLDGDCNLLVTLTVLATVVPEDGTCIMVGPASPSSISGAPVYDDGQDFSILVPMTFSTYDPDNGWDTDPDGFICAATFGCPGPVATEPQTFGNVKSLFK